MTVTDHGGAVEASEELAWAEKVLEVTIEILATGGKDASPTIRRGAVKQQILSAADELDSDLIVTGARGLGGFSGMILGSISRALSKAAHCPVLVVAHQSPRDDQLDEDLDG